MRAVLVWERHAVWAYQPPACVGNPTDGRALDTSGGGKVPCRIRIAARTRKGDRPMPTIAAPALTANHCIPPHIIQYCYGTDPSQLLPRGGRRVGMLAIAKCLKDQYDALATP